MPLRHNSPPEGGGLVAAAGFGRQVFRSAAGEGHDSKSYEKSFGVLWSMLPPDAQGVLVENLIAYIQSPLFSLRGAQ